MKNYLDIIEEEKIIPVIKIDNIADTLPLLDALRAGGIKIGEITFRTDCAKEAIKIAVEKHKDMTIGAGTVINLEQAQSAIAVGATFIVSPGFSAEVAKYCIEKGVLYIPGCVTPTDIIAALSFGINIIKFFPAEAYGGLKTLKALSAAFPQVRFVPTGGIDKNNIKAYLSFNKIVACGGSWMVKEDLIKNKEFDKISQLAREAKEAIR